jgi:hypothetical protein
MEPLHAAAWELDITDFGAARHEQIVIRTACVVESGAAVIRRVNADTVNYSAVDGAKCLSLRQRWRCNGTTVWRTTGFPYLSGKCKSLPYTLEPWCAMSPTP